MDLGTKFFFLCPKGDINMISTNFCGLRVTGVEMGAGKLDPADFGL